MIMFPLQITSSPDVPVNVADTLKIVQKQIIEQIKSDPNIFLHNLGDKFAQFGLKILAALALYIVGVWIIRRLRKALGIIFTKRKVEGALSSFILSLVTATLYVLLIIISISALGVNTTSIAALLAAGGMAVGMALSGTVQNFAGGIMIMVFKPFKTGDFISVMGYSGTVTDMSIVNTRILTTDNHSIILPNGSLSSGNIENFSSMPLRRVDWTVNVEYGSDAEEVTRTIKSILMGDERILDSKTQGADDVFVALSSMNENDISFTARAWVNSKDYWGVYFSNLKKFYSELPEHGFSFSYPHMDVTISSQQEKSNTL